MKYIEFRSCLVGAMACQTTVCRTSNRVPDIMFKIFFHETRFIFIEEAVMVGKGEACTAPTPSRMRTPPLTVCTTAGGKRGRKNGCLPFPSCLRFPQPHNRNAMDLPTPVALRQWGAYPSLECLRVCKPGARSFGTPKMLERPSSFVSHCPCDRGPT